MKTVHLDKRKGQTFFLLTAAIIVLEIIFFRQVIFNDGLFGDAADSLLNNMLAEHWFQFLLGKESWNDLLVFYPLFNTISYSDMGLGFAFPYVIFRLLGMNLYLSNKISLICLHVFGSLCLAWFLNKKLKVNTVWTLIGVTVFSYSGVYYGLINHTQMFTVSFLPFVILMIYDYLESAIKEEKSKKRFLFLFFAVASMVLLFYTAFYVGYFLAIFCLILFAVWIVMALCIKRAYLKNAWLFMKKHCLELLAACVGAVILLIPFLYSYLPTMKRVGSRSWEVVEELMPELRNVLDLSPNTVLYGRLLSSLQYAGNASMEGDVNFSVITIVLLVVLTAVYIKKNKRTESFLIAGILLTSLLSILLVVKFGETSLWYVFYAFLPGASALRAIGRYYLFLHLPMGILIAYCGNALWMEKCKDPKKSKSSIKSKGSQKNKDSQKSTWVPLAIPILLFALVLLANMKFHIYSDWSIHEEEDKMSQIADPPKDCEAMFLYQDEQGGKIDGKSIDCAYWQMKAWQIASQKGIKTINGYSGNNPNDWNMVENDKPNSLAAAWCWIDQYQLEHVYFYNLSTNEWTPAKEARIAYEMSTVQVGVKDGTREGSVAVLKPNGVVIGPFADLPAGEYTVSILGEKLSNVSYDCVAGGVMYNLVGEELVHNDSEIRYTLRLDQLTKSLEFRVINSDKADCIVDKIEIKTCIPD